SRGSSRAASPVDDARALGVGAVHSVDERGDDLAAALADAPEGTRRAGLRWRVGPGAPPRELCVAVVARREIAATQRGRGSEAARRHAPGCVDGGQRRARLAVKDAESSEAPGVACELGIGRQERDEGAVDAKAERAALAERVAEPPEAGREGAHLLLRQPLREVVERRRAPRGLVPEELPLARAERSRPAKRLGEPRKALAREDHVDPDPHA